MFCADKPLPDVALRSAEPATLVPTITYVALVIAVCIAVVIAAPLAKVAVVSVT